MWPRDLEEGHSGEVGQPRAPTGEFETLRDDRDVDGLLELSVCVKRFGGHLVRRSNQNPVYVELVAKSKMCIRDRNGGASVVGLDFDATVAWPIYDWMGVAKAALESLTRYLARDLGPDGIRVNLVAAGPIRTMAAKSIPGFSAFEDTWADRAPLGWDVHDSVPVAQACLALFSNLLPMTTGEILHVDGGTHAVSGNHQT